MMLSKEQKERLLRWAEALESEDWQQWSGELRGPNNERCCLGVACEVYKTLTANGEWTIRKNARPFEIDGNTNAAFMPDEVAAFFGLQIEPPYGGNGTKGWDECSATDQRKFIAMNDNGKLSFPEIAGFIREELLSDAS